MNNLNESPSDLIFKQKAIKYGPGEKIMKQNKILFASKKYNFF